jgi:hypothetical protein
MENPSGDRFSAWPVPEFPLRGNDDFLQTIKG